MPKLSAGLLLHRTAGDGAPEVLLVHPGGPFWVRRDEGVWSIPKGEFEPGEDPRAAAWREFAEELGHDPPQVDPDDVWYLGEVRQSSAKRVQAWAVPGDLDVTTIASNDVEMDWPRGSGRVITFPEIDRAGWFRLDAARRRILAGQVELLDRFEAQRRFTAQLQPGRRLRPTPRSQLRSAPERPPVD